MASYTLTLLPGRYAVCLLPPTTPIPPWASGGDGDFCAITRTGDELSIICAQDSVPDSGLDSGPDSGPLDIDATELSVARDWVLLRVEGPFAFDVTGVLATLSAPLAEAGVALLAVATYQTDYLLVKAEQLESALAALNDAGHSVN